MTWSFVKYLEHSECSISGTIFTVEIPKSIEWESGRESNTLEIPKAHTTANPLKSYLSRNIGELRSRKALGHECHCYADGVTSFSNPEDWRFDFCFWFYSFILSFSSIFFFFGWCLHALPALSFNRSSVFKASSFSYLEVMVEILKVKKGKGWKVVFLNNWKERSLLPFSIVRKWL